MSKLTAYLRELLFKDCAKAFELLFARSREARGGLAESRVLMLAHFVIGQRLYALRCAVCGEEVSDFRHFFECVVYTLNNGNPYPYGRASAQKLSQIF